MTLCDDDSPDLIKKTLEIIGDRYSALIIRFMHEKPRRFSELEKMIEGITPRTLSARLQMLEQKKIIQKTTCPESPGRLHYELTSTGKDLDEVIHEMAVWSKNHFGKTTASQAG